MATYTFSTFDDPLGIGGSDVYGINDTGQIVGDDDREPRHRAWIPR